MTDLLALSARIIDEGRADGPESANPMTGELRELTDGIAMVEAFSHVIAFRTEAGLAVFDTSSEQFAPRVIAALGRWTNEPVDTIVYTHGHVDHVGGAGALVADAAARHQRRPRIAGHHNIPDRFARYDMTNGYNGLINQRQFRTPEPYWMSDWVQPDTTFSDRLRVDVGGIDFDLRHDRGETDDHAWAWVPQHEAICAGDFLTWVFPNAGNPQKVQRYPLEWARALRQMAALEPELILPAHGLPIRGRKRISGVLDDLASALESLVGQTLALMNEGARLDRIIHEVELPSALLDRPYMRPVYDEPEFVVHNIWRLYGGWYDGNPANLKPAPDVVLAAEVAALSGGADRLAARATELAEAGDLRLACHLVELAGHAAPDDVAVHRARHDVYDRRRRSELSLMARGIYAAAARSSAAIAGLGDQPAPGGTLLSAPPSAARD